MAYDPHANLAAFLGQAAPEATITQPGNVSIAPERATFTEFSARITDVQTYLMPVIPEVIYDTILVTWRTRLSNPNIDGYTPVQLCVMFGTYGAEPPNGSVPGVKRFPPEGNGTVAYGLPVDLVPSYVSEPIWNIGSIKLEVPPSDKPFVVYAVKYYGPGRETYLPGIAGLNSGNIKVTLLNVRG